MKIKNKYIVATGIAGLSIMMISVVQKITHQPSADKVFAVSCYVIVAAGFLLLIKVLFNSEKNNFLNK